MPHTQGPEPTVSPQRRVREGERGWYGWMGGGVCGVCVGGRGGGEGVREERDF